ncbi:MAG: hypothetical protein AABY15_05120, partial [Nanoarchaeota archaeon]
MKTFLIKVKGTENTILISGLHIGYDFEKRKFGKHGLCCANSKFIDLLDGGSLKVLERLDKEHKFCIKTFFKPQINKDLY